MILPNQGRLDPMNPVPLNKIEGALLGAAVGDALGWPQEIPTKRVGKANTSAKIIYSFQSWKRRSGGRFWNHTEEILAGEYSDDTQLLVATARSILRGPDWFNHFCKTELPVWLLYERGGGRSVKASAQLWGKGIIPWSEKNSKADQTKYFMAGGNGVAMRIIPHALLFQQSSQPLLQQIFLNGIATHGHPRALIGGLLYGYAAWVLTNLSETLKYGELIENLLDNQKLWGQQPESILENEYWLQSANSASNNNYHQLWNEAVKETVTRLQLVSKAIHQGSLAVDETIIKELGGFDPKISGAGTVTASCSLYFLSRYAGDPKAGLLSAAFLLGADTDTLASMVGGLFGILYGTEWFEKEWMTVQDRDYILALANKISQAIVPNQVYQIDNKDVWSLKSNDKILNELGEGKNIINLKSLGKANLLNHQELNAGGGIIASSFLLQTEEGQTIYIKRMKRKKDASLQTNKKEEVPDDKKEIFSEAKINLNKNSKRLDLGIYINSFEVYLETMTANVFIAEREMFPDLTGLRKSISNNKLDISVYAQKDDVFGYGSQVKVLTKHGFKPATISLQEYPRLTERLIVEGYTTSLSNAGYTVFWRKGNVEVYQFSHPLLDIPRGIKMFRGFDIRGFSYWDSELEKHIFGVVIDATFNYRDQEGKSLSTADVVERFGSGVFRIIRQKQGELTPSGSINAESSRYRLLQMILPFVSARNSFLLPCNIKAQISLEPMRITMTERGRTQ